MAPAQTEEDRTMRLTRLEGSCDREWNCPTVHAPGHPLADELRQSGETVVVQGYEVTDLAVLAQLNLPAGERAVEIPVALLLAVASRLAEDAST
jgi:hypothetical protein